MVLQKKEYTAHLYKALFITWLRLYSRGVSLSQTNITTPTQSLSHAHLTVTCMLASIHVRFCYIQLTIHVHVFSFPDIAAIQLKMPNLHFLPVNLSNKDHTIVKVRLFLCLYILPSFHEGKALSLLPFANIDSRAYVIFFWVQFNDIFSFSQAHARFVSLFIFGSLKMMFIYRQMNRMDQYKLA